MIRKEICIRKVSKSAVVVLDIFVFPFFQTTDFYRDSRETSSTAYRDTFTWAMI